MVHNAVVTTDKRHSICDRLQAADFH